MMASPGARPKAPRWLLRLGRRGRIVAFVALFLALYQVSGTVTALSALATIEMGKMFEPPGGGFDRLNSGLSSPSTSTPSAQTTSGTSTPSERGWLSSLGQCLALPSYAPFSGFWPFALPCLIAATAAMLMSAPTVEIMAASPRSLHMSVIGAAALGGLIAVGVLLSAADLASCVAGLIPFDGSAIVTKSDFGWPAWVTWLCAGLGWALLLRRVGMHRDPSMLDRAVRWLFAGTAVEVAIAVPTFIAAVRRGHCYCAMASMLVIAYGIATLVLLCGPWLLLLATRRARMGWVRRVCMACGYPRHGSNPTICPECGTRLAS